FCVVPYTRGAEVSRPVAKIVDDVKRLADNGVRELTLINHRHRQNSWMLRGSSCPRALAGCGAVGAAASDEKSRWEPERFNGDRPAGAKARAGRVLSTAAAAATRHHRARP
ncbi:hypothetical protein MOV75_36110, partial [Bradyrhizobium sp. PRIMUS42]|nr:hypothetical protein [Bradyrhizobium sp. PRIMUS42]